MILKYKNYITNIEYSEEDNVFYGKIEGISDLVNFESEDLDRIEQEFHDAVDDYLLFCNMHKCSKSVRTAVEKLLEEADQAAMGKGEFYTYEDVFGEE